MKEARKLKKRVLETVKLWGRTELCCKVSEHEGKTRRGRLKGDKSKKGNYRIQHVFPYPKRGKHLVVAGKTVPAS